MRLEVDGIRKPRLGECRLAQYNLTGSISCTKVFNIRAQPVCTEFTASLRRQNAACLSTIWDFANSTEGCLLLLEKRWNIIPCRSAWMMVHLVRHVWKVLLNAPLQGTWLPAVSLILVAAGYPPPARIDWELCFSWLACKVHVPTNAIFHKCTRSLHGASHLEKMVPKRVSGHKRSIGLHVA